VPSMSAWLSWNDNSGAFRKSCSSADCRPHRPLWNNGDHVAIIDGRSSDSPSGVQQILRQFHIPGHLIVPLVMAHKADKSSAGLRPFESIGLEV
jgi:hypothetical protein